MDIKTEDLVPPSPENENNLTEWMYQRQELMTETVKFAVTSPEFHVDAYSQAMRLAGIIMRAALNSPSIGQGEEEGEVRRILTLIEQM